MKVFMFSIAVLCLTSCGGSGGGGGSASLPSLEGTDLSGTYKLAGVLCYNNTLTGSATAAANFTSSSAVTTIYITGNTYRETLVSSSCSTTINGKIVADEDEFSLNITNQVTTTSNQGNCNQHLTLNVTSGGTFSPNALFHNASNNATVADKNNITFLPTSDGFLLFSVFTIQERPSDFCFLGYIKQ